MKSKDTKLIASKLKAKVVPVTCIFDLNGEQHTTVEYFRRSGGDWKHINTGLSDKLNAAYPIKRRKGVQS